MPLPTDVAEVVARATSTIEAALDGLRPRLLDGAGNEAWRTKQDGTPVTDADEEAHDQLADAIGAAFPDHAILSEERSTSVPDADWCWVIDPIDGTSNFISGLPWWCVSVALTHLGEPVLAVVDAPALGSRWTAVRGGGATRDGRALSVRPPVDWRDKRLRHVPLMLTTGTARRARSAGIRLNPRVMGSTALDICSVADGTAAGSLAMVPHVWDVAAASLLVTEAGGVVATLGGERLLPLRRGEDHRDRSAIVATGPTRGWIDEVLGPLPP